MVIVFPCKSETAIDGASKLFYLLSPEYCSGSVIVNWVTTSFSQSKHREKRKAYRTTERMRSDTLVPAVTTRR
jgi:hypothetical protein